MLSVFNGFRDLLVSQNDRVLPDVEVLPASGKVIADADSLAAAVAAVEGVELASPVVADQALALYQGHEMPVMLRGVDAQALRRYTLIDSLIIAGRVMPGNAIDYNPPAGMVTVGVASRLRIYREGERLFLFAPRREGRINIANPAMSFLTDSIELSGVAETLQSDYDAATVIVPIEVARGLFQYDTQGSSIAVKGRQGEDIAALGRRIAAAIGERYVVKDRMAQQEVNFRMVQIEKWVTGLLLLFILIIASFNIISTMTMFVLEKRRQMRTLRALGMERGRVGGIFAWESLYITLLGGVAGILLGVLLCLLQQHFGLIGMQGGENMLVRSYPVRLMWSDLWIATLPILAIGLLTAWIAAAFARSRS